MSLPPFFFSGSVAFFSPPLNLDINDMSLLEAEYVQGKPINIR